MSMNLLIPKIPRDSTGYLWIHKIPTIPNGFQEIPMDSFDSYDSHGLQGIPMDSYDSYDSYGLLRIPMDS